MAAKEIRCVELRREIASLCSRCVSILCCKLLGQRLSFKRSFSALIHQVPQRSGGAQRPARLFVLEGCLARCTWTEPIVLKCLCCRHALSSIRNQQALQKFPALFTHAFRSSTRRRWAALSNLVEKALLPHLCRRMRIRVSELSSTCSDVRQKHRSANHHLHDYCSSGPYVNGLGLGLVPQDFWGHG